MWRKYSKIDKNFYQNYYAKLHKKLFSSRKFVFRYYLPTLDFLNIIFRPSLWHLHRKLHKHLEDQKKHWKKSYTSNYFYQGLSEIGIAGVKPTETRFGQYQIDHLLGKEFSVLDIGSNCGFVAVYLSRLVNKIDTVELNPYLNRIARDVLDHLNISNVSVHECDFTHFETDQKYDAILSFSNHHTIDGNFYISFQDYVRKLANMTRCGGYLFFESHNVWGPGKGGVGDDGDMEEKFSTLNNYYHVVKWRMVECYLPPLDIDKLFIVGQKIDGAISKQPFSLEEARKTYYY